MSDFPTKVLLATDGSEDAALASRAAADLSSRSGAELHIVHVWQAPVQSTYVPTTKVEHPLLEELLARELLEEQVERLETFGVTAAGVHLIQGDPAEETVRLSERLGVRLLVVGSRGLGTIASLVLGSVSEKIAYLSSRPTLILRGQGERAWPPQRIIVGDDASEPAKRAGEAAASIGKLYGAQVILVRTAYQEPPVPPPGFNSPKAQRERNVVARMQQRRKIKQLLEERASELEETLGSRPHVRAAVGYEDTAALILEVAAESDEATLIAVGSRKLGAIKNIMLGSVSRKVLRAASGSVLIAP